MNCPVIATNRFCCPCWPLLGVTCVSTGVPLVTVKPLLSATTSALVVSVTFRAPVAAAASMVNTAVAVVAELTVSEATLTPAPKDAVVVPCTQWVYCPVIVTDRLCCPCCPVFGVTIVTAAVPAVTVKPLAIVAASAPVAIVTSRDPTMADASTLRTAVALAGELTVMEATVTPAPKLAVVVP